MSDIVRERDGCRSPLPEHGVDGILAAIAEHDPELPSFVYERLDPQTRRPTTSWIGLGADTESGAVSNGLGGPALRLGVESLIGPRWPVVALLGYPPTKAAAALPSADADIPDTVLLTPREFLEIDHENSTVTLHRSVRASDGAESPDWLVIIRNRPAINGREPAAEERYEWAPAVTREDFRAQVGKLAHHFTGTMPEEGAVLSVPMSSAEPSHPLDSYRALRAANPSTCMFLVRGERFALWGSTSLSLFQLSQRQIIAETDGATRVVPEGIEPELFEWEPTPKELHEYEVVAKALEDDLRPVSVPGSLRFTRNAEKRTFFRLSHLFAEVRAELTENRDVFSVVEALYPHGATVGYPRDRALDAIAHSESQQRGPFAGLIGLFWSDGSADTATVTRSMWTTPNGTYTRAGAKIVPESDPDAEYDECVIKTLAVRQTARPQRR